MQLSALVAERLGLSVRSVEATLDLFSQDCTIPFVARYRKEVTGNLDEVQLQAIRDERDRLQALSDRCDTIVASLHEHGHWTEGLEKQARACATLAALEDFYLPYRPKRRTRATMAAEKGLTPLADLIFQNGVPTAAQLASYVGEGRAASPEEALAGARDIVAERIAELPPVRQKLRDRMSRGSLVVAQARGAAEGHPFRDHVGRSEPLASMPGHRLLAVLRGVEEKALKVSVEVDLATAAAEASRVAFPGKASLSAPLSEAVADGVERLVLPSLENEVLRLAQVRAEAGAIQVFAQNLREILLAAPLGQKALLAVDPGLRTGCKVVILTAQGALADHGVIYPLEPHRKTAEAERLVRQAVTKYRLEAVAVGNGTGGREAESWLKSLNLGIPVLSVNESGASVYSASEVAREEFPDHDVTVRGAVSIGRRLMDPLAELVKVDPKSIGVGQYQHDVDQKELKKGLDDVVISCVNRVGVDVNLATKPILTYVSGLTPKLAAAIVEHRNRKGPFRRRKDLLDVKGLGPKAFEQAAGFLRIQGGDEPLDASAVHPESYPVVEKLAQKAGCRVADLVGRRDLADLTRQAGDLGVGAATLQDIVKELEKPGRDPRPAFEVVLFDESVKTVGDLKEGMVLNGVVTNVTDFGAFVDVGVHQDGLVHVSQLANGFVKNPLDVVKPGQTVKVMVMQVDGSKKRISLSRKACL